MSLYKTLEKLVLTFSIKNCVTNYYYKVSILIEDTSSGFKEKFESEEKQYLEKESELIFEKKMPCNFIFETEQKITLSITKKNSLDSNNLLKDLERHTTLSSLISSPNSKYERELIGDNPEIICIQLEKEKSILDNKKYSLFDYFKNGLKLSCFISMDFSESEKNIKLSDAKDNYLGILKNISNVISNYLNNQTYYVYGFGGNDKNVSTNNSIFHLNGYEENSAIHTIETVIKSFNNCLEYKFITSDNNIKLSIMIKNIIKEIYNIYEIRFYYILFIILRNDIDKNEVKKTIDAIIESSYLPLTILILGVGKNDFTNIKKIKNKKYKVSSFGMEKRRDNIIFTSLIDDFSNNEEKMISWCQVKLSEQILLFYDLTKITPQNIYENKSNNQEDNLNIYDISIWTKDNLLEDDSALKSLNGILKESTSPFASNNTYQSQISKHEKIEDSNIKKNENEINNNNDKIGISMSNLNQNSDNNISNIEKNTPNSNTDGKISGQNINCENMNINIENESKKTKENIKESNFGQNLHLKENLETIGQDKESKGVKNNIAESAQSASTQNSDPKNSYLLFNS